jgi:hypothetical protein
MGLLKLSSYIGSGPFCIFLRPKMGLDFLHYFGTVNIYYLTHNIKLCIIYKTV